MTDPPSTRVDLELGLGSAWLLMTATGFLVLGVALAFAARNGVGHLLGALVAVWAAVMVVVLLRMVRGGRALASADGTGLAFPAWKLPSVGWEQVAGLRCVGYVGQNWLVVDVADPDLYLERLTPRRRRRARSNQRRRLGVLSVPTFSPRALQDFVDAARGLHDAAVTDGPPMRTELGDLFHRHDRRHALLLIASLGLQAIALAGRAARADQTAAIVLWWTLFSATVLLGAAFLGRVRSAGRLILGLEIVVAAAILAIGPGSPANRVVALFVPFLVLDVLLLRLPSSESGEAANTAES